MFFPASRVLVALSPRFCQDTCCLGHTSLGDQVLFLFKRGFRIVKRRNHKTIFGGFICCNAHVGGFQYLFLLLQRSLQLNEKEIPSMYLFLVLL
jgi:hypothetical protein